VGRAELDLVALDPAPPAEIVVVEVRARGRRDFGLPEETLDHAKRRTLRHAIATLRDRGRLGEATPLPPRPIRFDLVALEAPAPHRPDAPRRLRHYRAVPL
jgi:Holliday junction resolvase-like predicted endonuclease